MYLSQSRINTMTQLEIFKKLQLNPQNRKTGKSYGNVSTNKYKKDK